MVFFEPLPKLDEKRKTEDNGNKIINKNTYLKNFINSPKF